MHDGTRARATSMTSTPRPLNNRQGRHSHPDGRSPLQSSRSAAKIQVYSAPACQEIDQGFLDELSQTLDGVLYRLLAAHTSHNEMDPDNAAHTAPAALVERAHYLQDYQGNDYASPLDGNSDLRDPTGADDDDDNYDDESDWKQEQPYDPAEAAEYPETNWDEQQSYVIGEESEQCGSSYTDGNGDFPHETSAAYAQAFLPAEHTAEYDITEQIALVAPQKPAQHLQHQSPQPASQYSTLLLSAKPDQASIEVYKDDAGEFVPETLQDHCNNHYGYQGQSHTPKEQQVHFNQNEPYNAAIKSINEANIAPLYQPVSKVQPAATAIAPHQDSLDLGQKYSAKEALLDKFTAEPGKNQAGPYVTNNVPVIFPKNVLKSIKPGLFTSDMKMEAMPAIIAYLTVIVGASLLAADYLHLTKMVISLENVTWNPGGAAIFAAFNPC